MLGVLVCYIVFSLLGFTRLAEIDCIENGSCCNRYEREYSVFKKLVKLEEKLTSLTKKVAYLRSQKHGSLNSVTYIRWGRTSCPSGASVVYDGYVGRPYYRHSGAAVNALC